MIPYRYTPVVFCSRWPEAPDLATAARALEGRRGLVWLDGGPQLGPQGRFSYLGSDPADVLEIPLHQRRPLQALRELSFSEEEVGQWAKSPLGVTPPHWIGYIAYDAAWCPQARRVPRLERKSDALAIWMGRYDALLAVDHETGERFLVADDEDAAARLRTRLHAETAAAPSSRIRDLKSAAPQQHLKAIHSALEHISEGNIYQVNLARAWKAHLEGSPLSLWEAMRKASPVPFGMYLQHNHGTVLARTMERFLAWDPSTRQLLTRPIKGTIARSGSDDKNEATALCRDDKERAEHSMIVDLMRNDLSRVAEAGTVRVEKPLEVEPYRGLSHLVSTIQCTTKTEITVTDILEATFPPGSVTGAPKERAIEVIEEIEPIARGIYTGSVGYIDRQGGLSLAVAIRTAVEQDGAITYFAGGGLVEASIPSKEVAETELKARVFLDALAD